MRRNHGLQEGDTTIERSGFQTKAAAVRQSGMRAGVCNDCGPPILLQRVFYAAQEDRDLAAADASRVSND